MAGTNGERRTAGRAGRVEDLITRWRDAVAEAVGPEGSSVGVDDLVDVVDGVVVVRTVERTLAEFGGYYGNPYEDAAAALSDQGVAVRVVVDEDRIAAAAIARARRQAAAAGAARLAEAEVPVRMRPYTFARFVVQDDADTWDSFRARVLHANRGPEPVIGITAWNGDAAAALRGWTGLDGSVGVFGPVGVGKSTLVAAAVADAIRLGASALWFTEADLFDRVVAGWDRTPLPAGVRRVPGGVFALCRSVDFVVVDDFGSTTRPKEWQAEAMERIIAEAYNAARPVLLTGNTPIDAPNGRRSIRSVYGERVASRLSEMLSVLTLDGPSWRSL